MAFTVQAYPGNLTALADSLQPALYTFEETREQAAAFAEQQLDLAGPFPVFTIAPDMIASDEASERFPGAERTGWRALVTVDDAPLALVEIAFGSDGTELFTVRGREAAKAFQTLLRFSLEHVDEDSDYDIRWLTLPDVYVSSLWLAGTRDLFTPSRLGTGARPEPRELAWPQLRELLLPLIEAARPPMEFLERDAGSPRSGLPR
jgi:hypothetical protein